MRHWEIRCAGTVEGVLRYLRAAAACCATSHDSFERARSLLLAEVARVTTNGVTVQAEGDIDRITQILVADLDLELVAPRRETAPPAVERVEALGALRFAQGSVMDGHFGPGGSAVRPSRPLPSYPSSR